ncbi:MAG: methyltransferase [Bacteroidota bacterium]
MKVSTDGILLGAWAPDLPNGRVLDIGTGTGLLALMYAQRNPMVEIDALEIEISAAEQARENFATTSWNARIHLYHEALQTFESEHRYDLILCNPPYFSTGITPSANARAVARHEQSLDFADLLEHSSRLATPGGQLAVIIPLDREVDFIQAAKEQDWKIVRRSRLQPHPNKSPHRVMLLLGRQAKPILEDALLILDEQGEYTAAFRALTGDYYLGFAK